MGADSASLIQLRLLYAHGVGGSATKRTQTRDEGAHSQFAKRGKPNPVDIQAAHGNRLALHKAKVEARTVKKNPRKRGLARLTWTAQRDLFRDMSRRRRDRYAANTPND